MKKLKILYHHRVAAQDGQSVHILELTKALKAAGHEIIFVGPSLRPKEFGKSNPFLALLRKALPRFVMEMLEYAYAFRAYGKLKAAYDEHKPDVLYERYNLFLPAGRWLKEKTGIPYLVEINAPLSDERAVHSGLSLQRFARKIEGETWRAADMCLPVSDVLAEEVRARGVRPEAITTIHNGINFEDFDDANGAHLRKTLGLEGRTVLGFTGFLREWHRLDRIIDLIATFDKETSPHLMVVGEGPAVETCRVQAATLDIKDRVHFCGFQPREAIADHLAAMDIALQPAVTAYASPLKIFEYMESGLATIAPDQPNIREILTDNKDGLLFDPASETDLAEKAKRLIEDEPLRKRLGIEAKQTIRRRGFTWSRNAERVAGIAEAILRDRT